MSRNALPARFPPPRASARCSAGWARAAATNSWALIDSWGRLQGFAPQRDVREREPREGDAARGVPARDRQARAGRRRARLAGADDHGVVERRGGHDLLPRRRRRALPARAAGRDESLLGRPATGGTPTSAPRTRRASSTGSTGSCRRPRARTRAGCSRRSSCYQRWGFSRYSPAAGFKTFFKGGWRGTGAGQLVHEAALFERGDTRISMAVLTDGNPSHEYGTETLRGVAQRLFRGAAARAARQPHRGGRHPRHAPGGAGRRPPLRPGHPRGPLVPHQAQRDGAPLPGYCKNWALMHERAAFSLGQVQRYLRRHGLGLLILDAYRPVRATEALVRWAERTGRGGPWVPTSPAAAATTPAAPSTSRWSASATASASAWAASTFGPSSHTYNAGGRILRNRLTLMNAMERFGFSAYLTRVVALRAPHPPEPLPGRDARAARSP